MNLNILLTQGAVEWKKIRRMPRENSLNHDGHGDYGSKREFWPQNAADARERASAVSFAQFWTN
jgi:hypothetical protein